MPERLIAGRYRLGPMLGRGGMGRVWQARDELLGRDVAVKEVTWPAWLPAGEQQAARRLAVREARAVARLSHRNVIQVFDILEYDGCPWIVMELHRPWSLRDQIRREGPLSPAEAGQLGLEVLAALRAAHAHGVVHRDVKPANILLTDGRAVLIDFGIAQAAGTPEDTASRQLGSAAYTAPERARGGWSGAPADLWGLGVSLYEAVEGSGPFERGGDPLASLTAALVDEPAPALHAGPLWPVISGLLRKDPDARLGAAEAEQMLRLALAPASTTPTQPVEVAGSRARRPKRAVAALAGAAVLAVAATATAIGLNGFASQDRPSPAAATPSSAGRPDARVTSSPVSAREPRHPAASPTSGTPAGTRLTSRTSSPGPGPVKPAPPAGPAPHAPGKPGKGHGKGPGKGKGPGDGKGPGNG